MDAPIRTFCKIQSRKSFWLLSERNQKWAWSCNNFRLVRELDGSKSTVSLKDGTFEFDKTCSQSLRDRRSRWVIEIPDSSEIHDMCEVKDFSEKSSPSLYGLEIGFLAVESIHRKSKRRKKNKKNAKRKIFFAPPESCLSIVPLLWFALTLSCSLAPEILNSYLIMLVIEIYLCNR